MELVMCFGARTSDYHVNHIESYDQLNWQKSFAFQLYCKLTANGIIDGMQAYLTPVSVQDGIISCSAEAHYEIEQGIERLSRDMKELQSKKKLLKSIPLKTEGELSQLESIAENFEELNNQRNTLRLDEDDNKYQKNYGIIHFSCNNQSGFIVKMQHNNQIIQLARGSLPQDDTGDEHSEGQCPIL